MNRYLCLLEQRAWWMVIGTERDVDKVAVKGVGEFVIPGLLYGLLD